MEIVILKSFEKELNGFARSGIKNLDSRVRNKIVLLKDQDGFIEGQVTHITHFNPLREVRVSDFRIFFVVEDGVIAILSIQRKDQNVLEQKVFEKALKVYTSLLE